MKRSLAISLIFVFATAVSAVFAQNTGEHAHQSNTSGHEQGAMMQNMMQQGCGSMMNRGMMGHQFYLNRQEELGLTEEQVDELKGIRLDHVKQTSEIQADLTVARTELEDLLGSEDSRIGTLEEKIRDVHNLEADLQIEQVRSRIAARDVLTPEQRDQSGSHNRGMSSGQHQPGGTHTPRGGMMQGDNTRLHNQVH